MRLFGWKNYDILLFTKVFGIIDKRELDMEEYSHIPYRDITRKYYRKNVMVMDLGIFMKGYDITYHSLKKRFYKGQPSTVGPLRVLKVKHSVGTSLDVDRNFVLEEEYTSRVVEMHTLDECCVVIPNLKKFVGGYRFLPVDDIPTVVSASMGYLRCPNLLIAMSLSLWLRNPMIVAEVNREFKLKRRLKEMDFNFLSNIPVPEEILDYDIMKRVVEIDGLIKENYTKIHELEDELEELCSTYG